jgi:hypothetical protein
MWEFFKYIYPLLAMAIILYKIQADKCIPAITLGQV